MVTVSLSDKRLLQIMDAKTAATYCGGLAGGGTGNGGGARRAAGPPRFQRSLIISRAGKAAKARRLRPCRKRIS